MARAAHRPVTYSNLMFFSRFLSRILTTVSAGHFAEQLFSKTTTFEI